MGGNKVKMFTLKPAFNFTEAEFWETENALNSLLSFCNSAL